MTGPRDLSNKRPTYRKQLISDMDEHELRQVQQHPGAFGASTPRIQREVDQELNDRGQPEPILDDGQFGGDQFSDSLDCGTDLEGLDKYYDLPEADSSVTESNTSAENIDLEEVNLVCSCKCDVSAGEDGWVNPENHRDSCYLNSIFREGDDSNSSSSSSESSDSDSSGGGAMTMAVVGGAIGSSVGGPAGAAAGAAAGGLIGALFE